MAGDVLQGRLSCRVVSDSDGHRVQYLHVSVLLWCELEEVHAGTLSAPLKLRSHDSCCSQSDVKLNDITQSDVKANVGQQQQPLEVGGACVWP